MSNFDAGGQTAQIEPNDLRGSVGQEGCRRRRSQEGQRRGGRWCRRRGRRRCQREGIGALVPKICVLHDVTLI